MTETKTLVELLRDKECYFTLTKEVSMAAICRQSADRLESLDKAIRETLEDNRHLADGEDCTLIRLKRAIGQ